MKNFRLLILLALISFMNSCSYKNIYNTSTIKQIPAEEYIAMINNSNADSIIIIDVRTPKEFNKSHYKNAVNFNYLKNFKENTSKLDNSKTVFIYCETAHRSPYSAKILKENGFTKIYDLEKGYSKIKKK